MADEADRRAMPRRDLSRDYEAVRSASRLSQDDHLTYCGERAKLLLGCYRRNDANDPDSYVQAITLVLSKYPQAVVEYVTDPRTGIQTQEQFRSFPPNSGEVKAACDVEMRRIAEASNPRPTFQKNRQYLAPLDYPGCWAKLFIASDNAAYAAACAWANAEGRDEREWRMGEREGRPGIWVTLNGYDSGIKGRATLAQWKSAGNDAVRESLMRAAGQVPATEIAAPGGVEVSTDLLEER